MLKKIALVFLCGFFALSLCAFWIMKAYPASQTQSSSTGTSTVPAYSSAEIALHATPEDCWIIVQNTVYDVSSYLSHHPGGRKTITDRCGQETTSIFTRIHSNRAWNLLGGYQIGTQISP